MEFDVSVIDAQPLRIGLSVHGLSKPVSAGFAAAVDFIQRQNKQSVERPLYSLLLLFSLSYRALLSHHSTLRQSRFASANEIPYQLSRNFLEPTRFF
ncbi:hypothetical protein K239x_01790 [Planctomycetes bacterium K23_9]|uniref:Uncharacterized protein n=1 Tax=Stieleria marina TaxID=1930275 RepID=A0A517NM86_9BACT|nr:hypothetical protein K239x_01790 [Planctomycetes bacterium K23_9]